MHYSHVGECGQVYRIPVSQRWVELAHRVLQLAAGSCRNDAAHSCEVVKVAQQGSRRREYGPADSMDRPVADFFEQLRRHVALPPVVSRVSLTRALGRADLTPETVTPRNLKDALDAIILTLRVYHDEREVDTYIERLTLLCEDEL
jgi:hypothetical protein